MSKDTARLVMVVEDDVSVRRPLVKFLEMHGFSVVTAETSDEGLEAPERVRDPDAELARHDAFDVLERERDDVVLKTAQRFEVGRRQQVRARRQQLTELHVRRSELLEIRREGRRTRCAVVVGRGRVRHRELAQSGATHITLRITSWDQEGQFHRLTTEVLPKLGDG